MYAYATLGAADFDRACAFYDATLGPLGIRRDNTWAEGGWARYRHPDGGPAFYIARPFDGQAPGVGNGSMLAFSAPDEATLRAVHAAGLAAGGTDEGAPGPRPHYGGFCFAYLRDPEGHKLCITVGFPFTELP